MQNTTLCSMITKSKANHLSVQIKFYNSRYETVNKLVYQPNTLLVFNWITGFPNVLGCVDGTFVRILSPKEREGEFINRKGFHSLNVQVKSQLWSRFYKKKIR